MGTAFLAAVCASCHSSPSGGGGRTAPPPSVASDASSDSSAVVALGNDESAAVRSWNFDDTADGASPNGFSFGRTGEGREGKWVARTEAGAPSGAKVLAQVDADGTDYRFPVAWANEPVLRDLDLRVRCKPVSGKVDQACGLVFRLRDANNYYLTRANALESNVRLYFVKDGHRQQIASWSGRVTSRAWHELHAVAKGDHIEVFWNGVKVIDLRDGTFQDAGKVGVWTKADSVTYFDDLRVEPL